jgi:hypothetical protein
MEIELKQAIKKMLKACGFEVHRVKTKYWLPAKETIDAASKKGLSVGDYLEMFWDAKDFRQINIANMKKFGLFDTRIENICEIGTGSGLYTEFIVELCKPIRYESYEPDKDWSEWLAKTYNIISHDADGRSLSHTSDSSINFLSAHGVFVYLPFLVVYKYFQEIVRVTADNGFVCFDICSEDCFDDELVEKWLATWGLYRVPEIVTRGRFPDGGESDSTWRTQEARHVGSDTIAPGF